MFGKRAEAGSAALKAPPSVEAEIEKKIEPTGATPVSYTHLTLPTICSV